MSTNDSHKLRHSASVKNASPHMNGGGPHIQIQKRPVVTTNDGTVIKRPTQTQVQGARPVLKVRMDNGQPQREVEVSGGTAGRPAVRDGVGTNASGKRMIMVRMDNGKPKADNGRSPGGKMQRIALPGRKSPSNDPRFANLRAQRDRRQQITAAPSRQLADPNAGYAPISPMSNEQLMLCRYAVKRYAEAESNELTEALCGSTLKTIDNLLALQQGQESAIEAEVEAEPELLAEIVDPPDDGIEIEAQDPSFEEALDQAEPNKLTPDQLSELGQFEEGAARPRPRPNQGAVRPFAARPPGRPAPIDTEPDEPDLSKSE